MEPQISWRGSNVKGTLKYFNNSYELQTVFMTLFIYLCGEKLVDPFTKTQSECEFSW